MFHKKTIHKERLEMIIDYEILMKKNNLVEA